MTSGANANCNSFEEKKKNTSLLGASKHPVRLYFRETSELAVN